MFKQLYQTFYYSNFTYLVNASQETVIEQLNCVFMKHPRRPASLNLSGKFVDYPHTFYMTQHLWWISIQNVEREPALLKGKLSKISDTQTRIDIAVRPNSVFLMLMVVFLPVGLFNLYRALMTKDVTAMVTGLWFTFFGLPVLFIFARFTSKRLRQTFEKYMHVTPDKALLPPSVL